MASVILHVGAHKTGTTALQSTFYQNRGTLARAGVIYPDTNWYHYGHHRLAFALLGRRDQDKGDVPVLSDELDALNAVIARADKDARIFVSSEELLALPPEAVQHLKDGIACDDIRVLAVVRRPDELLLSIYNQSMKSPLNKFRKPLQGFVDAPDQLHRVMDQPGCVTTWIDAFGQDRVILWSYESADVIPDCLRLLGLSENAITPGPRVNSSVSAAVLEVMRISKTTDMAPALRKTLFQHAQKLFADYPMKALSGADRRRVLARYEGDFDALFAAFGQPNPYRADSVDREQKADQTPPPIRLYAMLVEHLLKER
ncbi:hypothetical protein [Rhodophyticola sp.]|jgi:hypothetical protein|uniref:hypothetical protein n=1 Tax=Rhodophyticola sp. TaxID=2680032 RepID=UPI003D2B8B9E